MLLQNCSKCGCLTRANNQECRKCAEGAAEARRRELAEKNRAAIEWAMVGETKVDWEAALALSAGAHKCDEAEYRLSRMHRGKDD